MQAGHQGAQKSGPLTYTENYVFNKADILGKGATATVYLGRHRLHGNVVAIKEFDQRQIRQIFTAKKREIEVLRTIKHKNVMGLLACEPEAVSGQEVIVMEYCQGGSVFTMLENPQNMFGFQEEEFLRFLKDICSGLKHLRSLNIIHRDIKPGNIMKKIDEDGSTVFVLTDFGAARELPEDETFMSVYGTEEYIHPDMYQRAVLRQPGQNRFDCRVDIWSLAVTMYHCACGHLPFRAYGGRQDSRTMYEITSGRRSGVISGVQRQLNGPIEWSRTLPETCHLSSSLRKLLEPILAGAFEPEPSRQITYDGLFTSVENIFKMAELSVFVVQTATQVPIFIPKHERLVHLQEAIARLTEIPSSRQLLLVSNKLLTDVIESSEQQIQEFPKTVLKSQLVVYDRDDADYVRPRAPAIPDFPSLIFGASLSSDVNIAKRCTGVSHFIEVKLQETLENQSHLQKSVDDLWHYTKDTLQPTETCIPILEQVLLQSSARFQSLKLSQTNLQSISSIITALEFPDDKNHKSSIDWSGIFPDDSTIGEVLQKAKVRVREVEVYLTCLIEKMKEQQVVYSTSWSGCEEEKQDCLSKFQQIQQNIASVYTTFLKHKKYGELHNHEIFIHQVESRKLEELCVKVISLYQNHCLENITKMHRFAVDFVSKMLKNLIRSSKVTDNVKCVIDCQTQVNDKLDKIDECYRTLTQTVSTKIHEIMANHLRGLTISKAHNSVTPKEESYRNQGAEGYDSKASIKRELLRHLIDEVDNLQNQSLELDVCLQANFESLVELKRLSEESSLNTSSLGNDGLIEEVVS